MHISQQYNERLTSVDGKFLFATAQLPFDAGSNQFCTLIPIWSNGSTNDPKGDFPNRQLCWFLIRDSQFQDISPGQLIFGSVEPSTNHGTNSPDKDWWQIKLDTASLAGTPGSVIEIVDGGSGNSEDPRILIDVRREIELSHKPSSLVMIKFGQWLYGPFRPKMVRRNDFSSASYADGRERFTLERTTQNRILKVQYDAVRQKGWIVTSPEAHVSLEATLPGRSTRTISVGYTFLSWDDFERLQTVGGAVRFELLTDADILLRAAREHLSPKKKRQELKQLLDELADNLSSLEVSPSALTIAKRLGTGLAVSDRDAGEFKNK